MQICEKTLKVLDGVVEVWCGNEHMVFRPHVRGWEHPGGSRGYALLLFQLYVGQDGDALVVTCRTGENKVGQGAGPGPQFTSAKALHLVSAAT